METGQKNFLLLPANKGLSLVETSHIIRIQAISNYSRIYLDNGRSLTVAKVLAWFDEKLRTLDFIRIHRTHLVNIHFVSGYEHGNDAMLLLQNGDHIHVSRRRKRNLKKKIMSLAA